MSIKILRRVRKYLHSRMMDKSIDPKEKETISRRIRLTYRDELAEVMGNEYGESAA